MLSLLILLLITQFYLMYLLAEYINEGTKYGILKK